jgi:hypothetical protein
MQRPLGTIKTGIIAFTWLLKTIIIKSNDERYTHIYRPKTTSYHMI